MGRKIILILFFSLILRLIALNQSLWLDEATTARVVLQYNFHDIIFKFSPVDFHPPLYYLFMKLWTNFFGYSEIALRLPSVLFSLLAGYIIYRIGTLLKDKKTGIWAMLFYLFNPLIMFYSQEARMYSMATFLLTVDLYLFIKLLKGLRVYEFSILFGIVSFLAFATFYGSIFFIVPMQLLLLAQKRYRYLLISSVTFYVLSLMLVPLLYHQFTYSRQAILQVTNWSQILGKTTLKNLILFPIKFTIGRISFEPKILYYLIAGGWGLAVGIGIVKQIKKQRLLFSLSVMPIILGVLFSIFSPLLQYFRFLYCLIPLCILLAFNRSSIIKSILLFGFIVFSGIYLFLPQFHREDWKSLVQSLPLNNPIYMIIPSSDPIKYYAPMYPIHELRTLENIELARQITVIPYTADIYGYDYKKALTDKGFINKETKNFRGLTYEIWEVNKGYAGSFRYSRIDTIESMAIERNNATPIATGGLYTP